jgi:hypothetical protein
MFGSASRRLGVLSGSAAAFALAILALPLPAQASVVGFGKCDNSSLTQPFARWGDYGSYKLAPGADFEGALTGWLLQGGASVGAGSESFGVTGSEGSASLSLPAGATATSPQTCVNAAYPDFRLFARADRPGATIVVSVVYGATTLPVGLLTPTGEWEPTLPIATGSAIAAALDGGTTTVAVRFKAMGGTAQIDDVYVDPYGRCC